MKNTICSGLLQSVQLTVNCFENSDLSLEKCVKSIEKKTANIILC